MRAELALALLLSVGCAHVETRVVQLGPRAPALPSASMVTVRPPPLPASARPAREVAIIEVTSAGTAGRADVLRALREAGRRMGADLVLWMREDFIEGFGRVIASGVRTRDAR